MSNKKPIIGISGNILIDSGGIFPGYRRCYINEDYVKAVIKNGGVPIVLPITDDLDVVSSYIDNIDGLILSGGHDVSPYLYGEEPSPKLGEIYPQRDEFDFALIEKAKAKKLPILGICRGLQILNVYHQGSLWQDLSYNPNITVKHSQDHGPTITTHSVSIAENSMLEAILKTNNLRVNSFHHQAIKELGSDLKVSALASDQVIEAFEHKNYPFLVGIQWHPEMLHEVMPVMNAIFKEFIKKASQK